jgi:hypothetical protein
MIKIYSYSKLLTFFGNKIIFFREQLFAMKIPFGIALETLACHPMLTLHSTAVLSTC